MFRAIVYFTCIIIFAFLLLINYQNSSISARNRAENLRDVFNIQNLKADLRMSKHKLAHAKKKIKSLEDMMNLTKRIEFYKQKYNIQNIVANVFYGRKLYTKILFRYLDRNLKTNGGILDKVIISNHLQPEKVNVTDELIFLNNYLDEHKEGYEVITFKNIVAFNSLYTVLHNNDLVFKIDDDIVFISDGTFEAMVDEYFKNNHLILSANVINHHTLSPIHANMNLMEPFYETPQMTWIKSDNKTVQFNGLANTCINDVNIWKENPKCGAIAHENFLYHTYLKKFNLNAYNFILYNFNAHAYKRWRTNFLLFKGSIVNKIKYIYPLVGSDEEILTVLLPQKYKKHSFALGSAVVVHFSYSSGQVEYLEKTDILKKYEKLSIDYLENIKT